MRLTATLIFLSTLTVCGCTTSTQSVTPAAVSTALTAIEVALIDEGVYETLGDTKNVEAPQTAAGKVGEHGGLELLEATRTLVAEKGVTFGYRFALKGPYNGTVGGFEMHAEHPSMLGVDGKSHTSQTVPIEIDFEGGLAYHDVVYVLSEDFEVLPGNWTLEIRFQGKPLISRHFILRPQ
jgi:hypothetical protein